MLQIQDEATEALRRDDPEWIGRLVAEVEQPDWTEPPPQTAGPVAAQGRRPGQGRARPGQRWRTWRPGWTRRSTRATRSAAGWRVTNGPGWRRPPRWPPTTRSPIGPGPALDWLDDQDRRDRENREHAEAVADLVRALDYPGTLAPAELERLAHAVQARGDGLPEGLRQRYITRLRARRVGADPAAAADRWPAPPRASSCSSTLIYLGRPRPDPRATRPSRPPRRPISDLLELGELDHAVALVKKLEASDPDLIEVPCDGRGPPAGRDRAGPGVGPGLAVRPGDARGPGGPRLGQAAAGAGDGPLARPARYREGAARRPGPPPRRRAPGGGGPAREGARPAPRRDRPGGRSAREQARAGGPGRADDAGPAGVDRRFPARAVGAGVRRGGGRRRACRSGRANLSDRLEAIRTRMDQRGQQARLEDAITAAVAYSPDGRGFSGSAELASALQAFAKAFPDSPRSTGLHGHAPRPAGLGRDRRVGPPHGRLAGRPPERSRPGGERPRRAVPAVPRPASRRRPTSIARRPTGRPWRPCRIARPTARARWASSRS